MHWKLHMAVSNHPPTGGLNLGRLKVVVSGTIRYLPLKPTSAHSENKLMDYMPVMNSRRRQLATDAI